mmetsp:Transcript_3953/g.16477  ORF Transcript_3953/g.16477 Transcript_3953/m.16477 type:complete len:255 (+) Transcript_3953:40-804(+)
MPCESMRVRTLSLELARGGGFRLSQCGEVLQFARHPPDARFDGDDQTERRDFVVQEGGEKFGQAVHLRSHESTVRARMRHANLCSERAKALSRPSGPLKHCLAVHWKRLGAECEDCSTAVAERASDSDTLPDAIGDQLRPRGVPRSLRRACPTTERSQSARLQEFHGLPPSELRLSRLTLSTSQVLVACACEGTQLGDSLQANGHIRTAFSICGLDSSRFRGFEGRVVPPLAREQAHGSCNALLAREWRLCCSE